MTRCPFCKKAVVNPSGGPCPSCGKAPPAQQRQAPAAAGAGSNDGDDWDAIERGASGGAPTAPSSYSGGSLGGLGDDDDSSGPGLSLELDTPARPSGPVPAGSGHGPSAPPAQQGRSGASGSHPAYGSQPMPQPLPARSLKPASDPTIQQSTPNNLAPPSSPQIAHQQAQLPPPAMMAPHPHAPTDPAAMIARFPPPPAKVWETPIYAIKVMLRQFELRQDLAALKKKRSPDVPLYERALKTHDGANFVIGILISCALVTVALFVFFLPVILRFVRDPD